MKRFANTFLHVVGRDADTVSGTGRSGRYRAQLPRWLALARWDRRVHDAVARRLDGKPARTTSRLIALALLCRYRPRD